jgi:PKD repeat protein
MKLLHLIFSFFIILCISGTVSATNYYASPIGTGNGLTVGAPGNPQTLATNLTAGDTLYLMSGTYTGKSLVIQHSGTSGNPITITAYSGTPWLHDTTYGLVGINANYNDWINISGLKVTGYWFAIVNLGSYNNLTNCEVGDVEEQALNSIGHGSGGKEIQFVNIEGCKFHDTAMQSDSGGPNLIDFGGADVDAGEPLTHDITFKNNDFYGKSHHQTLNIMCYSPGGPPSDPKVYKKIGLKNVNIIGNRFHNIYGGADAIYTIYGNGNNFVIQGNQFYDLDDRGIVCKFNNSVLDNNKFWNISDQDLYTYESEEPAEQCNNITISNNLLLNNDTRVGEIRIEKGKNIKLQNNTAGLYTISDMQDAINITNAGMADYGVNGWAYGITTDGVGPVKVVYTDNAAFDTDPSGTIQHVGGQSIWTVGSGENWVMNVVRNAVAPTADFSASPRSGTHPLAVQFTDASTNDPTSWSWNFGDSQTSTSQSPSHTYNSAGTYTVTLTATNAQGSDGETKIGYITVSNPAVAPVANFSANTTGGDSPLFVQFSDLSSNSPTGWSWNFGDSQTSTSQNPLHTYSQAGTYTVTLTASNTAGSDGETKTGYITVTTPSTPATGNKYWIDPQRNLWLNPTLNNATQYFTLTNTTGYTPDSTIMWENDNFASGSLNTTKWTAYKGGTDSATVSVVNGKLSLSGLAGGISSGNVILNKNFTSGTEIIVNQTQSNIGRYTTTSFGNGTITNIEGGNTWGWYGTMYPQNGAIFYSNGYSSPFNYVENSAPGVTNLPVTTYGVFPSTYITPSTPHTLAYGYDSTGKAYVDALGVTGNYQAVDIPDPYGSGQFVHPSIYYNESGLFGHKYWLAATPYEGANSTLENPCLYYSDDGMTWFTPRGVTNPIDPAIGVAAEYNSDPEILYNPSTNKLMIYYREYHESPPNTYLEEVHLRTYDGSTVSNEIICNGLIGGISPSVILDGSTYYMWLVNWRYVNPYEIHRFTSTDGINWSGDTRVYWNQTSVYGTGTDQPWHLDTIKGNNNSKVYSILTISNAGSTTQTCNLLATADTITSNFTVQSRPVMKPGTTQDLGVTGAFYKATMLWRGTTDAEGMDVWYSYQGGNYEAKGPLNGNGWGVSYCRVKPAVNGTWVPYDFSIQRAHLMKYQNTAYLSGNKTWMLSQGEYTGHQAGIRNISAVYARNIGHDPAVSVWIVGSTKYVSVTPTDNQTVSNYQVMIPGSSLGLSTQSDSVKVESIDEGDVPDPIAEFTSNATSGNVPLTVVFTDTSQNTPTAWNWSFGDGAFAITQNATHTYSSAGTYTVSLNVSNAGGYDVETKTGYITATSSTTPPTAAFSANRTSGNTPLDVAFTDSSTNSPTSWAWDFNNDGVTDSTSQNPTYTYSSAGTYTVTLTATNAGGSDYEIKSNYITASTPSSGPQTAAEWYYYILSRRWW